MTHVVNLVREAVYREILATGRAPSLPSLAASAGLSEPQCRTALQSLADAHVLVLHPDGETVRFAAPFAGAETPFRIEKWYAPCAWDAFGICAALHIDAAIHARCAYSGEALECGVRGGASYGKAVVHLLVPAARFWENIVYT
jgi:hypothetical protein